MSVGMYASGLLIRIRRDLDTLSGYIARIEQERLVKREDPSGIPAYLGEYNYATYTEIRNRASVEPDFPLDSRIVKECEEALDRYLETYAPGQPDLKRYVTALSLYLIFIAHRPLHPTDLPISDHIRIVKRGNWYYCTGKRRYRDDPLSLCCFCVCRAEEETVQSTGPAV
ncbi:MAG: DUF2115 family protein [Methanoregula sp.]|uniref:DUF2115 family protein n=1 Tax=Methanoregula sp. TaxID=2052170 RepID=UPI003C751F72